VASLGIQGIVSYSVSRRCSEIAPLVKTWSEMMGEKRLRWR
jgi:hypothetical protein